MVGSDIIGKQKYIFGRLISLSNKMQAMGDRYLSGDDITIRQWLLMVVISQFDNMPPTLGEAAGLMGSSHQNVKQIALNLKKRGLIYILKDKKDGRVIRLKLTEKSYLFWEKRQEEVKHFLLELFTGLSWEEIDLLCNCLNKLSEEVFRMEKSLNR